MRKCLLEVWICHGLSLFGCSKNVLPVQELLLHRLCWMHSMLMLNLHSAESLPCCPSAVDLKTSDLTFRFMVGKLMVGKAKPSLLEVLHSKPVSPLRSLYHKSEEKNRRDIRLKTLTDELKLHRNVAWIQTCIVLMQNMCIYGAKRVQYLMILLFIYITYNYE